MARADKRQGGREAGRPGGDVLSSAVFLSLLLFSFAAPASAVFEDAPAGARQLGFGGQAAALEDPLSFQSNPALAGGAARFETGAYFLASDRTPLGQADFSSYGAWALVPRRGYGKMGTFSAGGLYRDDGGGAVQKTLSFGWGTWQLLRAGSGSLDFGANFKILQFDAADGEGMQSGAAVDLGAAFRPDGRHVFGFSALNINRPSFGAGILKDKAPLVLRLGVSESREDFTLSLDVAQRSASGGRRGNFSLNPGMEYVWRTGGSGVLFSRTGLVLADRASALGAGLGWKRQSSELAYSAAVPLTGAIVPAHAVTLSLRFGDRDTESEYERLIRQEMKYRKDLVEALDGSAKREEALKKELVSLKDDVDALNERLKSSEETKARERGEKERLEGVMRRQAAAEAELRDLARKRSQDRLAALGHEFTQDWQNYLRLKNGGAPKEALKAALERLVGQYQDAGIDISQATVELREIINSK